MMTFNKRRQYPVERSVSDFDIEFNNGNFFLNECFRTNNNEIAQKADDFL